MKRICMAALMVSAALVAPARAADPLLAPGDPIVAIWNTTAGGDSTDSTAGTANAGQYPAGEAAPLAIVGKLNTKYLNFGTGGGGVSSLVKGVGTGFYVTPVFGNSVATGFRVS